MNKFNTIANKTKTGAKKLTKFAGKRMLMLAIVAVCAVAPALATGNTAGEAIAGDLGGIGNTFAKYVGPVQKIVYALAAICAMIGAFTIYFKMSNGDQDVMKTIMLTIGGCVGLVTLATVLPKFFGVNVSETVTFQE